MVLLLFPIISPSPVYSVSSGYLDVLNEEAGTETVNKSNSEWKNTKFSLKNNIDASTQEIFEEHLKAEYFGSYVFYQKLSPQEKESVYNEFKNSNDIETVRNKIIELLKK